MIKQPAKSGLPNSDAVIAALSVAISNIMIIMSVSEAGRARAS